MAYEFLFDAPYEEGDLVYALDQDVTGPGTYTGSTYWGESYTLEVYSAEIIEPPPSSEILAVQITGNLRASPTRSVWFLGIARAGPYEDTWVSAFVMLAPTTADVVLLGHQSPAGEPELRPFGVSVTDDPTSGGSPFPPPPSGEYLPVVAGPEAVDPCWVCEVEYDIAVAGAHSRCVERLLNTDRDWRARDNAIWNDFTQEQLRIAQKMKARGDAIQAKYGVTGALCAGTSVPRRYRPLGAGACLIAMVNLAFDLDALAVEIQADLNAAKADRDARLADSRRQAEDEAASARADEASDLANAERARTACLVEHGCIEAPQDFSSGDDQSWTWDHGW